MSRSAMARLACSGFTESMTTQIAQNLTFAHYARDAAASSV
jgi:hypothetical protein